RWVRRWAAFSPNGKLLVTTTENRTARVWEVGGGRWTSRAELWGHTGVVWWAAFSPDSNFLATASGELTTPNAEARGDGTVQVGDLTTGQSLLTLPGSSRVSLGGGMAWSADGKFLVTARPENKAQIYACDVCGSVQDLKRLAYKRVTQKWQLSPREREMFLHEP